MLFLGIKYLIARKRQTFLTFLGIFFGSAAFVVISGFFLGFREYLIEQLVNNSAHVHIQSREDFLTEHMLDKNFFGKDMLHAFWISPPSGRKDEDMVENPSEWYRRLKNDPRVVAYSPQLTSPVILSKGKAKVTTTIIGCDPLAQLKVTTIGNYMIEGNFKDLAVGGNRIVIGEELMKKLGGRVSQNIFVSLAQREAVPFKIVGIFKTGTKITDNQAFGSIHDVQRVNNTPNVVNEIAVRLKDFNQARSMANNWSAIASEKIESWDQQNANFFNVFKIQDAVRYMTIATIMIVASFGIYNVLNMTVMQKRKDIAILRSLGFNNREVIFLFFSQGLVLGITGTTTGLITGNLLCRFLQTLPFGGGPLGGSGHLQISLNPMIYVYACLMSISATLLASILPAYSAGKLTPIDIIRAGAE